MVLEWGPVVRGIGSRPALAVAFAGLSPGLRVQLHLVERHTPGADLGCSALYVVPEDGSLMLSVDVPGEHGCDRSLGLVLIAAEEPSRKLWAGDNHKEDCSVSSMVSR